MIDLDKKINYLSLSHCEDIFKNKFDLTWAEILVNEENRKFTIIPPELYNNAKDDGLIEYLYNKDFFRCDDFKKEHDGKHILFAGCSNTEGVGAPIEEVWSKIVYEELCKKYKLSGFFNIAKAGYGWQKIINNFNVYSKKYGFPEYLIILMPNVKRSYDWKNSKNKWIYGNGLTENNKTKKDLQDYYKSLINFYSSWTIFIDYCLLNNTKVLWGSWSDDYRQINNLDIPLIRSNEIYIDIQRKNVEKYISKNLKINDGDLHRRDGHEGRIFHKFWADNFIKAIHDNGLLNE